MIQTQISFLDATVLAIMLMSSLFAFFRGFVREMLSLGAWIGAGIVTIYYFPQMAEAVRPHFKSQTGAIGVSTLGIYTISLLGFSLINMLILKFVKSGSDVGMLDNMLGFFFGAFRGGIIISMAFFIFTIFEPNEKNYPEWLTKSFSYPYVEKGAVMLTSVAPQYLQEISSLQKKVKSEQGTTSSSIHTDDNPNTTAPSAGETESSSTGALGNLFRKEGQ